MVKIAQKDFARQAPQLARSARIFFFCGDEAGVQDAAHTIAGLLPDAGERIEFSGAEAKRDPVRLADEARSTSLFGDKRHIWVRSAGDEAHDAVELLLGGEGEPCPVIIQAANASDKARTAKLLDKAAQGVVVLFYPPDLRSVTGAVRQLASAAGLRMGDELAQHIAAAVGLDTRLAASEVSKLALYLGAGPESPRSVTTQDFERIGAGVQDDGFASLVRVVLGGDLPGLPQELRRMRELDLSPVGVVLAFERRVAQLVQLAGRLGNSGNIRNFLEAERASHRVFFKDIPDITTQLTNWRGAKLARLSQRVAQLHRALIEDNKSAGLLLSQELLELTKRARSPQK